MVFCGAALAGPPTAILLTEIATAPATPAAGEFYIYALSADSTLYGKGDDGTAHDLEAATLGADSVNDTHIDWGTGANQVELSDIPATGAATDYIPRYDGSNFTARALSAAIGVCISGTLSAESTAATVYIPFDMTLTDTRAYADTAPSGSSIKLDIRLDGATIYSGTKLNIAAAANSGTQATFGTTAVTAWQRFNIDVNAVGSATAGGDNVAITIVGTRP